LIDEGIAHGLKLKSSNPEDLVTMRLLSGVDMRQRMGLLTDLRDDYGLAVKAKGASADLVRVGWREINAPDRERWLLSPDVLPLWDNGVQAKGLWSNEGFAGNLFRRWMAFKNIWVPIKLALSLSHPLHVLHINAAEQMSRAWVEATQGHFYSAAKEVVLGALDEGRNGDAGEDVIEALGKFSREHVIH
jgi:hypothetical protein